MNLAALRGFALLAAMLAAAAHAATVPQDIGFPDVEFASLSRPNCEVCHGSSLADRHHGTQKATQGQCTACHKVRTGASAGVQLERECTNCHKQSPHHQTQAAKERKCTSCHSSPGLSPFRANAAPAYAASKITPKRGNCRNCHGDGTVNGLAVVGPQKTHHSAAAVGCDTCHGTDKSSSDVRPCERCHDVAAIHQVQPHVAQSACTGCHRLAAQ